MVNAVPSWATTSAIVRALAVIGNTRTAGDAQPIGSSSPSMNDSPVAIVLTCGARDAIAASNAGTDRQAI